MPRPLHPTLGAQRRAQLMRRGVALFDGGRHFAAHECWEEIWRSTTPEPRDLFQGLVQVAAAFHHLHGRHRADVAARVLAKARRRLQDLPPVAEGIDVGDLRHQLQAWESWLSAGVGPSPPAVTIRIVV